MNKPNSIRILNSAIRRHRIRAGLLEKALEAVLTEIQDVSALRDSQAVLKAKALLKDTR